MKILFEDRDIIVIDKPAGQIVHPAPGHETGSITSELICHCPEMVTVGSVERPGVVHRLDIDTSGVMVFAKNRLAYIDLRRQFERHNTIVKKYLAILHGCPSQKSGTLDSPVGKDHLRAITHWTLLAKRGPISLVEFVIETGRMHQIRIHASEMGCPVVGDSIYGNSQADRHLRIRPKRQLLHAVELTFTHPTTHKRVTFAVEPPNDIIYAG